MRLDDKTQKAMLKAIRLYARLRFPSVAQLGSRG